MVEPESDVERAAKRRVGTVLRGKYRLDRVLGIGGMAVVYKATHRNQAELAVKMLHPELCVREDVRTRFLREGYAANSVKHPGAVLVVDDDVAEDGAAFLVMELLEGEGIESLWERSPGRRVPVRGVVAILHQLLDVLAAAHAKGIVHRDIKPANLFATRDGALKVLDFGIARARDAAAGASSATGTGILLGTPAFMAPEQAMAQARLIDGQTDLWAAGATAFSLLAGDYVHEGENASQLMIFAATKPARRLAALAPEVPPAIAHVIDGALAFDKGARWASAQMMRDALEAAARATYGEVPSKAALAEALVTDEAALAPTQFFAAAAREVSVARSKPLVSAATTAQPVASTASPTLERSAERKRGVWQLAAVVAVFLLFGAGIGLRLFGRESAATVSAAATPVSIVQSGAAPPALLAPSSVPSSSPPPVPPAAPAPATSATNVDALHPAKKATAAAPRAASAPTGGASAAMNVPALAGARVPTVAATRGGLGVAAPAPAAAPAPTDSSKTPPKPDCSPNYTFDASGNKHFKPQCF